MGSTPKRVFPTLGGTFLGVLFNKDYSILGSMLGSPYLGKLPYKPKVFNSIVARTTLVTR